MQSGQVFKQVTTGDCVCMMRGAVDLCVCFLTPSPIDYIPEHNGIKQSKLSAASFNVEPRKMKDVHEQKHISFHNS